MSAIAGLSWWRLYVRFFDGAIKGEQSIDLSTHCNVTSTKRSRSYGTEQACTKAGSLGEQNGRIAIAFLPPYAPEFNAVKAIWAYLHKHEIADLCPYRAVVRDFARRRLRAFWQHTELAPWWVRHLPKRDGHD